MTAELTSRPEGTTRHPWDWYVEERWVTHRLCDFVNLDQGVTYLDPFCGLGNIPLALNEYRGLESFGTDLFERDDFPLFLGQHDFLGDQRHLLEAHPRLSIVMNPPFSFQDGRMVRGLAEKCIRRALDIATDKVCALLPLKWLSSEGRFHLFTDAATAPIGVYVLSERPSMPPGDMIEELGDNAFERGKVDYMWVVWDNRCEPMLDPSGRPFVPTYWIPPRSFEAQIEMELAA